MRAHAHARMLYCTRACEKKKWRHKKKWRRQEKGGAAQKKVATAQKRWWRHKKKSGGDAQTCCGATSSATTGPTRLFLGYRVHLPFLIAVFISFGISPFFLSRGFGLRQHHQGDGLTSSLRPVSMGKEQRAVCSGGLVGVRGGRGLHTNPWRQTHFFFGQAELQQSTIEQTHTSLNSNLVLWFVIKN